MTTSAPAVPHPVLTPRARVAGVIAGVLTLVAGGVSVFLTDNELGSTALVTAGVVMAGLAVFGNRLQAVEAAGVRLELERQALRVQQQAVQARVAGENDRAVELERRAEELRAAARAVGLRYERLRSSEPSGWDRTSRMEATLRDARALGSDVLTPSDVAEIFATGTDGNRIAALALIEGNPRLVTVGALVEAIVNSRSAFEQYHALVAAESAVDHLAAEDRSRVRDAVESVLSGPLGDRSSDRRTVARRVLERMTATEPERKP